MWPKNKVFTRTTGLSLFSPSVHGKRDHANMLLRKGAVHHAGANILAKKFKFSGWNILGFVLNSNILSPNAYETLIVEVCSFITFKPPPMTSAVLPHHHHSWGPSLQMAQPAPPPAVEPWAITTWLLSLSALVNLQLTQIPHITALLCPHLSRTCYWKQLFAQQPRTAAASAKCGAELTALSSTCPFCFVPAPSRLENLSQAISFKSQGTSIFHRI